MRAGRKKGTAISTYTATDTTRKGMREREAVYLTDIL